MDNISEACATVACATIEDKIGTDAAASSGVWRYFAIRVDSSITGETGCLGATSLYDLSGRIRASAIPKRIPNKRRGDTGALSYANNWRFHVIVGVCARSTGVLTVVVGNSRATRTTTGVSIRVPSESSQTCAGFAVRRWPA